MTNRSLIVIGSVALALLAGMLPSLAQEVPDEWHAWIRKGEIAPIADALDKDPSRASRADGAGIPPLFWAALYGQRGVVELLLTRGADVNSRCHLGVPLHAAVVGGRAEILRALLAKGARVDDEGGIRLPPVVLGARRGSASAVEILIQAGAAVDARDAGGNTALLLAASHGHEAVLRILLARGADAGATDRFGITAHDAATREGHTAIAELLRGTGRAQSPAAPPLAGAYLGQERPGLAPRVFAPGVVSTERRELNAAFTPDGRTLFFSRDNAARSTQIMMTRRVGETWQAPVRAAFSTANDVDMFVTADGQEVYFCSNRQASNRTPPAQGPPRTTTPSASSAPPTSDIWVARKEGHMWGPAVWLGPEVNSTQADDYYPTVSRSGTLYFSSNRPGGLGQNDIYRSRRVDGRWTAPENLGATVNTAGREYDPFIAPDESYLIFASERPGGFGAADLYVSVRRGDGTWCVPVNLGPDVNSSAAEYTPMLSPDGRYLFFTGGGAGSDDIYWIDASVIAKAIRLAEKQVSGPIKPDFGRLASGQGAHVFNRTLTAQKEADRTVARLDARPGDGGALIDGVQIGEGIIEVDLRGKDVAQRSFLGIAFHFVDWTQYEAVYFRPFNFRAAAQEQRSHAVQYISHPVNTWQKLRAERPGQFEKAIDPPPDPSAWFHARIVLVKSKVEVYVNGETTPSLVVDDLGEVKSGGVALWAGNGSDGAYAGLTITPTAPPGPPPASRQTIFDAARTGNVARLRALVEADPAAVNRRMLVGATPLHLAAANGQKEAAEYLISKGADVNAVARHAGTPLDMAYESNRTEFVRWLESKGGRFTPLRFDVTTLTPAIHRVAFPWGMMNNVLVFSGTDGAVLVDTGFSRRALDELRKVATGFSSSGIRYVINSHDHGDHVAGNALAPDAAAVINAAALAAPPAGLSITPRAEPLKGRSGRTLPTGYTWRTGGADITLIPRPGLHSDADLIVYFPRESVVAMGDLLLSESVPAVTDLPGYLAFLDDVLDVFPQNTTFVCGHGRDLDAAGVRTYRDDLKAMIGIVQRGLAEGRTAEQLVNDDALKAYKSKYSLLSFLTPDMLIPRVTPPQAADAAMGAEDVVRSLYRRVNGRGTRPWR